MNYNFFIKQLLFLIIALVFVSKNAHSQYVVGSFIGASDYSGDLANTPLDMKEMSTGGGVFAGYYLDDYFQVRGRLTYQRIGAHDENQKTTASRNLHFRSDIIELAALVSFEYDELEFTEYRLKPNVYIGAGIFNHNPKAENSEGEWIELQPLGTEGQGIDGYGSKYRRTEIVIPFGGGLKYKFGDHIIVEAELSSKKVFTDYLDDVSGHDYIKESVFLANGRTQSAEFAYRADEIGGVAYSALEDDAILERNPRNLSKKDDWYYMFSLGASYYLPPIKKSKILKNRKGVPNKYSRF